MDLTAEKRSEIQKKERFVHFMFQDIHPYIPPSLPPSLHPSITLSLSHSRLKSNNYTSSQTTYHRYHAKEKALKIYTGEDEEEEEEDGKASPDNK